MSDYEKQLKNTHNYITKRLEERKLHLKECLEKNDDNGIWANCNSMVKLYTEKGILEHVEMMVENNK
ncbi:MAG: hypothetical protein R3321_13535 [Nitrososphaeraceae archaeon]|nr:hypothetical protein [Nitrososphaeraceae archaeon]